MTTPYRHMNTYLGDPIRALLTAHQNKIIKEEKLSALALETGDYLTTKLHTLADKHSHFV